jgi:amino acid adenylation domain-containing protein
LLLLAFHHIIFDAWSEHLLLQEVTTSYQAFSRGSVPSLPVLTLQYGDYACWEQAQQQQDAIAMQLAYWRDQLSDLPALQFPTDFTRPANLSSSGRLLRFSIPDLLRQQIQEICKNEGVTLFMCLLASIQVLLVRYTDQEDIAVGSPLSHRSRPALERTLGCIMNVLVLRTNLAGNPGFREVLHRVKAVTLAALAHQDVAFERLVSELQPERDSSRNPLYQIAVSLQSAPLVREPVADLHWEPVIIDPGIAKVDFEFALIEFPDHLEGYIQYNTELLTQERMEQMALHWQRLLTNACVHPDLPIFSLPLFSPEETERLLQWSQGPVLPTAETTLIDLFTTQADLRPDAIAVEKEGVYLSFAAFLQRARAIARHLCTFAWPAETLIGISIEKEPEMLVAIAAVLLAGLAYLPLDPRYPTERLRTLAQESGLRLLVLSRRLRPEWWPASQPLLDLGEPLPPAPDGQPVLPTVWPDQLAYVLYTSGSSGLPKGVAVSHRGLVNVARDQRERMGVGAQDRVLQFASWNFDASVYEILMSWGSGATLCLRESSDVGAGFVAELERRAITSLTVPPSEAQQLALPACLTRLIVAGETAPVELAATIPPTICLFNAYGPTESSIEVTHWRRGEPVEMASSLPIGSPLSNTACYLLDGQCALVPLGLEGELFLAGVGIARGYWQQPDLTAQAFLPNPYGPAGSRLYRTGDRARFVDGGELLFLGRRDQQIKLRGYRIELGEIEAVLSAHPLVEQVVVVLKADRSQVRAWIKGTNWEEGMLRSWAQQRLPDYLLPSEWLAIASWPLTPNGKIDRVALAEWVVERSREEDEWRAGEDAIKRIWQGVLGGGAVGPEQNFFGIGGHSLLAVKVVGRLREELGLELSVGEFFAAPTIRALAALGQGEQQGAQIHKREAMTPVPVSYEQERMWFMEAWEGGQRVYQVGLRWRLRGMVQRRRLGESLWGVQQHHEALRTRIVLGAGSWMQEIGEARELVGPLIDLTALAQEQRAQARKVLWEEEQARGWEGASALWRVTMLQEEQEQEVWLSGHHAIWDGRSAELVWEEVWQRYRGVWEESEEIGYGDYALWQREREARGEMEEGLAYWREQLAGVEPLRLPTDHARPARVSFAGAVVPFALTQSLSQEVEQLAQEEGATLFMCLLAAFSVVLAHYTGQEDLAVGTPVAYRPFPELEGVVGCFMNTLVLRTRVERGGSYRELLRQVKQTAAQAYAHQDIPFERLVHELQPERDLSRNPLFQVMFSLQNVSSEAIYLPDLEVVPLQAERKTAKFDLTIHVLQDDEGLRCEVEYCTDLFRQETIERFISHWLNILKEVVHNPDRPIWLSKPLSAAEEIEQIQYGNHIQVDYPETAWLHEKVIAQAEQHGDAIALVAGEQQISYRELVRRARLLAGFIQQDVEREAHIGLYLERTPEMVIGILAIMLAGCTYIPLDPAYPQEFLNYMVNDAHLALILTTRTLRQQLEDIGSVPILLVDKLDALFSEESEPQSFPPLNGQNLIYVIYTSGSTGKPKGVMNTHEGLSNRIIWMQHQYPLEQTDRILQKTSISFDVSVWEIFYPLISGACLVLARAGGQGDSRYLLELMRDQQITIAHFIPSMLHEFLEEPELETSNYSLKRVFCSGEALLFETQEKFFSQLTVPLVNLYGPTEAAIEATVWECQQGESVTIGRAIANVQAYVLDDWQQIVPPGVEGEVYLGGIGLARGYWNKAELTAERYLPNPYGRAGERLYRTGDRARCRLDGAIEYLGRRDQQIKLRGYRIELEEIEAVLRMHPGVEEIVVVMKEKPQYLRACIKGEQWEPQELQNWAKARLPAYMVPTDWLHVKEWPKTTGGKFDRLSLARIANEVSARPEADGMGQSIGDIEHVRNV